MAKDSKLKITVPELVLLIVGSALALWGLTYIVLGLIADNLQVSLANNPLKQASNAIQATFGLSFFGWGLIIFSIGCLIDVITLVAYAVGADKDFEKKQRRAARINRNVFGENQDKPAEEIIEAEVK